MADQTNTASHRVLSVLSLVSMVPWLDEVILVTRIKLDRVCSVKMAFGGSDLSVIRDIKSFDTTGHVSVGSVRWRDWIEEFESCADRREQRRAP